MFMDKILDDSIEFWFIVFINDSIGVCGLGKTVNY